MRTYSMAAAIVTAAGVFLSAGTATATPVALPVSYRTEMAPDHSVVTTLDNGTFALPEGATAVRVRDTRGRTLTSLPLRARVDNRTIPLRQRISPDGRTLVLAADTTGLRPAGLRPVASPLENQLALNDLINAVSIGTSVGSLIGTAIGAVLGVGAGVALAGASCLVLTVGCVVAVLPIVALAGGVGGLIGSVAGGGPTTAIALYQYFTTLNAPPGTTQYAHPLPGRTATPAPRGVR